MDRKRFSRRLVELMRKGFPELYAEHVKGRRREFIAEHAPKLKPGEDQGEVLGRVPQYLQILWAIAELQYERGPRRWPKSRQKQSVHVCRSMAGVNLKGFGMVVELGFWECVADLFEERVYPRTKTLRLNPDWTVSLVPTEDVPRGTADWTKYARLAIIGEVAARTHDELMAAMAMMHS